MLSTAYRVFYVAARTENFKKAAEELFVSQPAVSKQIQLLEHTLGYPLFTRTTRSVRLTSEGQMLYQALLQCTIIFDNALAAIETKRLRGISTGTIKIGMLHGWDPNQFGIPFISNFKQKHPEVAILYERNSYQELVRHLQENELHLAVLPLEEVSHRNGIAFVFLGRYKYKIVLSRNHPASMSDRIMDKLDDIPFCLHPDIFAGIPSLISTLRKMGIHSEIQMYPNMDSMFAAVEAGDGWLMALPCSRMCHQSDLRLYDVEGYDHCSDVVVAYRADVNDTTVKEFINALILLQAELPSDMMDATGLFLPESGQMPQ